MSAKGSRDCFEWQIEQSKRRGRQVRLSAFGFGGSFSPPFLMVAVPYGLRVTAKSRRSFRGLTAAAVGAIAGAAVILAKRALIDVATVAIALCFQTVLIKLRKVPEPALIL